MSTAISVRDEREAWIALASVDGVGEAMFARLLERYGSAHQTLAAARSGQLRSDFGRRERCGSTRSTLRGRRTRSQILESIVAVASDPPAFERGLAALGIWALTPFDGSYPARLRVLDPPPAIIFGRGASEALSELHAVAVVGTRRPTALGRALAARIGAALAGAGVCVISGLAIGVDGAAQAATIEHRGRTVGVLGSGHARAGPTAHRDLMARIVEHGGAVVSEMAPDSRPTQGTFPRRNRIISALADAVIVVEAPVRSGALITAAHALEQGRDVFVVPGRPGDPATAGCLALLRETPARIVVAIEELLHDLRLASDSTAQPHARVERLTQTDALGLLSPVERAVALAICAAPGGIDSIVVASGLTPGQASSALTLLQLRGWVQSSGAAYLPAGPLLIA